MSKKQSPIVFFNASVILAGFASPAGGSAKLLHWVKTNKIKGMISEIVLDEVIKRSYKIGLGEKKAEAQILSIFSNISSAPPEPLVNKYKKVVTDPGDSHLLASCQKTVSDYLVSLDKKHVLVLQDKVKFPKIVSPKQLIEKLSSY